MITVTRCHSFWCLWGSKICKECIDLKVIFRFAHLLTCLIKPLRKGSSNVSLNLVVCLAEQFHHGFHGGFWSSSDILCLIKRGFKVAPTRPHLYLYVWWLMTDMMLQMKTVGLTTLNILGYIKKDKKTGSTTAFCCHNAFQLPSRPHLEVEKDLQIGVLPTRVPWLPAANGACPSWTWWNHPRGRLKTTANFEEIFWIILI